MPRKFLKRLLPDPSEIKKHKALSFLGERIFDPNVWHINRRSVTAGVSIGMFIAFVPIPGQMALAATTAIFLRANLPLSVALVWITNPITIWPMFYFAYLVGSWILQKEISELSGSGWSVFFDAGLDIGLTFLFGCFVVGVFCSAIGNIFTRILWRFWVMRNWSLRKALRKRKQTTVN